MVISLYIICYNKVTFYDTVFRLVYFSGKVEMVYSADIQLVGLWPDIYYPCLVQISAVYYITVYYGKVPCSKNHDGWTQWEK